MTGQIQRVLMKATKLAVDHRWKLVWEGRNAGEEGGGQVGMCCEQEGGRAAKGASENQETAAL
eukprot:492374-Rhodomonas_salina.3